jgi:hypothetical protein
MLHSQAHWLVARKSQYTTKTSQRACLSKRTADRKDAAKMKEK